MTSRVRLPAGARSLVVFVEIAGTAQIAGYAVTKDNGTSDGPLVFMYESKSRTF